MGKMSEELEAARQTMRRMAEEKMELQRQIKAKDMRLDACLYAMVLMQQTIRTMRDGDWKALAT